MASYIKEVYRTQVTSLPAAEGENPKIYSISVLLLTPSSVPPAWGIELTNGGGNNGSGNGNCHKKPSIQCSSLDEALICALTVSSPSIVGAVHNFISQNYGNNGHSKHRLMPEELYQHNKINPVEHQQILGILRQNPALAYYLNNLPDMTSLPKEEQNKILTERMEF